MKTNYTKLKPYVKKNPKVTDPIRYPKVVERYEFDTKKLFAARVNMMVADITKQLVNLKIKE